MVPRNCRTVVALASDVPGVLAAEALAREFARRAQRWTSMPGPDAPLFWEADTVTATTSGSDPKQPVFPRVLDVLSPGSYRYTVVSRVMSELGEHHAERASGVTRSAVRTLFAQAIRRWKTPDSIPPYESEWARLLYGRVERERQTAWHRAIEEHRRAWYFAILAWAGEALESSLEPRALRWVPESLRAVPLSTLPNPFEPVAKLWRVGYALRRSTEDGIELFLPLPAARW